MALPVLDATFASSVDLPRRQMLAKWLVEELVEIQAPSDVLVSGAGSSAVNGLYIGAGFIGGKKSYNSQSGSYALSWNGTNWGIRSSVGGIAIYTSSNNVEFPWQATTWIVGVGTLPVPTVSESPAVNPVSNYYDLPERYLWAKIAVAAGASRPEADYVSLPKNYAWSDIYNAVASASGSHTDWTEKQALGHIAAAYRGDTANPEALATYINWPWRYQVASIVTHLGIDADALSYIQRVEAADGASLESGVRLAIDNFVRGCKTDGIWDAIKASTILAGARTLSGALQPLVGAAPTNFNFVSGDYNRKTGLVGDGTTKYLDSNRANDEDPQNDQHMAIYVATAQSGAAGVYIGCTDPNTSGATHIGSNPGVGNMFIRNRNTVPNFNGSSSQTGFLGMSRALSSGYGFRSAAATSSVTQTSQAPSTDNIGVFFRIGASTGYTNARLAFYSIGESLDLAMLDTRVTNLINAYAAAIP
jgi:hypothetical protein